METINAQSLDHARQTIINHFLDRKFDVADVTDPWMETAEAYLEEYTGDFTYLVDVQQAYRRRGFLSPAQAKGVLNCLRAQVLREREQQVPAPTALSFRRVPNGTYTVVVQDGSHVTLRLSDPRFGDFSKDTQVLAYLSGCNNEADFSNFAFVTDAGITVWKKFRGQLARQLHAAEFLHRLEHEAVLQAGFAYAMSSGRCFRCNRTLTVPASIHQGLGPECAKVMHAARETAQDHQPRGREDRPQEDKVSVSEPLHQHPQFYFEPDTQYDYREGEESYHVFERGRRNEFGERYCVAPFVTYAEAQRLVAELNGQPVRSPDAEQDARDQAVRDDEREPWWIREDALDLWGEPNTWEPPRADY